MSSAPRNGNTNDRVIDSFNSIPEQTVFELADRVQSLSIVEKLNLAFIDLLRHEVIERQTEIINKEEFMPQKPSSKAFAELNLLINAPYTTAYTNAFIACHQLPNQFSLNTPFRIFEAAILRAKFAQRYPALSLKIKEDAVLNSGAGTATPEIWSVNMFNLISEQRKNFLHAIQTQEVYLGEYINVISPNVILATDPNIFRYKTYEELYSELTQLYHPKSITNDYNKLLLTNQGIYLGTETHLANIENLRTRNIPINGLNIFRLDPETFIEIKGMPNESLTVDEANLFIIKLFEMTNLLDNNGIINLTFGLGNSNKECLIRNYLAEYLTNILAELKIPHIAIDIFEEVINLQSRKPSENIFAKIICENHQIASALATAISINLLRFSATQIPSKQLKQLLHSDKAKKLFINSLKITNNKMRNFNRYLKI